MSSSSSSSSVSGSGSPSSSTETLRETLAHQFIALLINHQHPPSPTSLSSSPATVSSSLGQRSGTPVTPFPLPLLNLSSSPLAVHHQHHHNPATPIIVGPFDPSVVVLGPNDEGDVLWQHGVPWTVGLSLAYVVVFVLGLVGNCSVLWVIFILRRSSRHSIFANCNKVFNGLIGNLALADLLVILFCLPANLIQNVLRRK